VIGATQQEIEGCEIRQTPSGEFTSSQTDAKSVVITVARKWQTPSPKSPADPAKAADVDVLVGAFPLSWSQGDFAPKGAAT
jgi:hypothetical protein